MSEKTRGANCSKIMRRVLAITTILFVAALLIAPVAAAEIKVTDAAGLANALGTGAAAEGTTVTVSSDITLADNIIIELVNPTDEIILTGDATILRGCTGYLFTIKQGTLTLGDTDADLVIHGNDDTYKNTASAPYDNTKSLILVEKAGAKLIMNPGVVLRNNTISDSISAENEGGAVSVNTGAEFAMNGGEIQYNKAYYGGAVHTKGIFSMSGGTIEGNTAFGAGGGIAHDGGTSANICGTARIIGNTAIQGGGIAVLGENFTIDGEAEISGNMASITHADYHNYGGGFFIRAESCTISGDVNIHDNMASDMGGGFYIYSGSCTISGDIRIHDNIASEYGGGIMNFGTLNVNGGEIYANEAPYGTGIGSQGTITMTAGKIHDNTASGYGGGIYNLYGTLNVIGGEIYRNTAEYGGGIISYGITDYPATVTIKGGEIYENTAPNGNGGGVYLWGGALKIEGTPSIVDNTANDGQENIYLEDSLAITISGEMKNGAAVGITAASMPGAGEKTPFTDEYGTDCADYFFADKGNAYHIIYEESKLKITTGETTNRFITWMNESTKMETEELAFGTPLTYSVLPTKPSSGNIAYEFIGWSPNKDAAAGKFVDELHAAYVNMTYYAIFKEVPNSFTVEIQQPEHGTISASQTTGVSYQQTITLSNSPANSYQLQGYTVTTAHGYTIPVSEDGTFLMPAANVVVSAVFEEIPEEEIPEEEIPDEETPEEETPEEEQPDDEENQPDESPSDDTPKGSSVWLQEPVTPTPTETQPTETPTQTETPEEPSGDDDTDGGIPPAAFIGGGLAVLIIAGLVAFAVLRRR